jgi:DNA-binding NtrC family response regulator
VELLHVLVVDDEEELVEALVERLNMRGIVAEGVTTGAAALERIPGGGYDVVLVDVKMPPPGGLDVLRQIKSQWPDVAVVLLTGHGSLKDAKLGTRLGAFEYLMKPFDIDELTSILLKAAEAKERPSDE